MKKSAGYLTMAAAVAGLILLLAIAATAPFLAELYADIRGLPDVSRRALILAFYLSAVPTAASLICILKLLVNIRRDQPFLLENITLMSVVSWCCLPVAAACGAAGIWYMPLIFITAAMLFLFLIVRVVRGCFISAFYLKEENSLTI